MDCVLAYRIYEVERSATGRSRRSEGIIVIPATLPLVRSDKVKVKAVLGEYPMLACGSEILQMVPKTYEMKGMAGTIDIVDG
jgi:hypothetical protein